MDVEYAANPPAPEAPVVTTTVFSLRATHGDPAGTLHCSQAVNEDAAAASGGGEQGPIVLLCHGYCDHQDGLTMSALRNTFTHAAGLTTFALDLTGFGRSSGLAAYIESFDHLVQDVLALAAHARSLYPDPAASPMFLVGESMGGAVALQASRAQPELFAGLVLYAPMIAIHERQRPPAWQIPLFKGMSFLAPTWAIVPRGDDPLADCFRDPAACAATEADPLHYNGNPRLRTAYELLNVADDIHANLEAITTPFLVLHGQVDLMCPISGSHDLIDRASAQDKSIITYPDAYHALPVDPDGIGEKTMADALAWILARV